MVRLEVCEEVTRTGIWGETVPWTEVTIAKALKRLNLPCTFEEQGDICLSARKGEVLGTRH